MKSAKLLSQISASDLFIVTHCSLPLRLFFAIFATNDGVGCRAAILHKLDFVGREHDVLDHAVVGAINEGPTLDLLVFTVLLSLYVLEDLTLLLFSAVKGLVLLLELHVGVAWSGHLKPAGLHDVPFDILKEGMCLDLGGAARSSSETLAWIPVQEVHYQVLGLLGHADGQLQYATLDVVE